MMILGLPFPTYLGWFVGPILTIATAVKKLIQIDI